MSGRELLLREVHARARKLGAVDFHLFHTGTRTTRHEGGPLWIATWRLSASDAYLFGESVSNTTGDLSGEVASQILRVVAETTRLIRDPSQISNPVIFRAHLEGEFRRPEIQDIIVARPAMISRGPMRTMDFL